MPIIKLFRNTTSKLITVATLVFVLTGTAGTSIADVIPTPQPNLESISNPSFRDTSSTNVGVISPGWGTPGGAELLTWGNGTSARTACTSFTKSPCDGANRKYVDGKTIYAAAGSTACTAPADSFCIENLVVNEGRKQALLENILEIPVVNGAFTGDPVAQVPPSGSEYTIWKNMTTGDLYASRGVLYFSFDKDGKITAASSSLALSLTIRQIAEKRDVAGKSKELDSAPCLIVFDKHCYVDLLHKSTAKLSAQIRIPFQLKGWFFSRASGVNVSTQPVDNFYIYKISGTPALIPTFAKRVPKSDCPQNWCPDALFVDELLGVNWEKSFGTGYMASGSWQYTPPARDLTPWQAFVAMTHDRASDLRSDWSFSLSETLTSASQATGCGNAASGINGVLASNAMIYSSYGPELKDNAFSYRVAGLHYMPDGVTPVSGYYELQVDSKLARCIFKLKNAPISASLSIVDDRGSINQVVGGSSESAGMFRVFMQGFHFSMPKLLIKVTQGTPKKTILCKKVKSAKLQKYVSGITPKCPTGFVLAPNG